jgi:hypothetical protein
MRPSTSRSSNVVLISLATVLVGQWACNVTSEQTSQLEPAEYASGDGLPDQYYVTEGVVENTGRVVRFNNVPPRVTPDSIFAYVEYGSPYAAALADIDRVLVAWEQTDVASSLAASVGVALAVVAGIAALVALTKESCPFVYSWDGERFVFDAEPYGGATTRGLERADYSELEHLVAANGEYRLQVTNEVDETQHTNLFELWVVDHEPGTRVVAGPDGTLHTVRAPMRPTTVRDASGQDLTPWLRETDHLIWEHLPVATETGDLRQDLVMTFPKPEESHEGKLIANVTTGLWGSHMIRLLLEMRGTAVGDYYAFVDEVPQAAELVEAWNLREELFAVKLYVKEPTGWEERGILPAGGPFIAEHRAIRLDLSRVQGDSVQIRLRPPVGFWALNSFAMEYSVDEPVSATVVQPKYAKTRDGRDVLAALRAADDLYYDMPTKQDRAELRFDAPDPVPGYDRTVFLHSQGYYRLHLLSDMPPDLASIREIEQVPDATVRLAVERYAEWRALRADGELVPPRR